MYDKQMSKIEILFPSDSRILSQKNLAWHNGGDKETDHRDLPVEGNQVRKVDVWDNTES
jgi:hypothetical protein